MKRVLLTGMSGTGKSTVIEALKARGYKALDADYGLCCYAPDGEWVWDEHKVAELLATKDTDVLFLAGCASNQGKFRSAFDHVILLSAPAPVMMERLATRTNNPFGKTPQERACILEDLDAVEPLLRRAADHEIDTQARVEDVVEEILRLVGVGP